MMFKHGRGLIFWCCALFGGHYAWGQGQPDSVTVSIAPEYDAVSGFHRFLFGEGYRKLWAAPVKMKVFYLSREKGGLTILQKGGGLQTKSLRLRDSSGKEWLLRSVQKYPERALPKKLRATIAKDILQDQVVTSHPYAALTIPPLAEALGVPHSHPEIVFVPDDPALGEYRKEFGNSVLLFEEREPEDAADTDNSEKVKRKLRGDNDVRIDQQLLLRARLLDHLVGDWDRHEDQWRWEKSQSGGETVYTPVPRDRDKVYYTTSGLFPGILSRQSGKTNLQPYRNTIRDINGYNYNNRFFDRYFLTGLSEKDWKEQIHFVQQTLTDSVLEAALHLMPDTIYRLSAARILATLKARRDRLEEMGMTYYKDLAKYVDIPGTEKNERFEAKYGDDGHIELTVQKINKEGVPEQVMYQRDFDPAVTREIRVYGIGGYNVFSLEGSHPSPIKMHLVGGKEKDVYEIDTLLHNKGKIFIYDRKDQENLLPSRHQTKFRLSNDSTVNEYNARNFRYEKIRPLFAAFYNLDKGAVLRAGFIYETQSFRKEPYGKKHLFDATFSSIGKSFLFTYTGDFKKRTKKNDLVVNILAKGPNNIDNFFGIGNESVFINKDGSRINYYQNYFDRFNGDVRLYRNLAPNFRISAGPGLQVYHSTASKNQDLFLGSFSNSHPEENVFGDKWYSGFMAGAEWNTKDETVLPAKGFYWRTEFTGMWGWKGSHQSYGQVQSELVFYLPLFGDSSIVIANRIGGGTSIGEPAFFQQLSLGGLSNLRGFYANRFTGRSLFYHSIELRAKLFDFTSYLFPGTVGIVGFNDLGRVWVPGENSSTWHQGYGGGIFIIPADLILVQAAVARSVEGIQPYVSIGLSF
ncbi:MAG: BamA/TamA family outer membrane protein [Flavisolibacter sp.]